MWIKLRTYLISGLLVFLPLSLTVYLLTLTLNITDNYLGKFIEPYFLREFGFYFKGLSIIIFILMLVIVGFLVSNFLVRRLHRMFERVLLRLPFFKQVYPAMKEISAFFLARDHAKKFKQVVFLEYPRRGLWSIGFITNDTPEQICRKIGRTDLCHVFLPSSPGPFTGYVLIAPKSDLIFSDMSVEQGIKLLVSGGVVNPFVELPEVNLL